MQVTLRTEAPGRRSGRVKYVLASAVIWIAVSTGMAAGWCKRAGASVSHEFRYPLISGGNQPASAVARLTRTPAPIGADSG